MITRRAPVATYSPLRNRSSCPQPGRPTGTSTDLNFPFTGRAVRRCRARHRSALSPSLRANDQVERSLIDHGGIPRLRRQEPAASTRRTACCRCRSGRRNIRCGRRSTLLGRRVKDPRKVTAEHLTAHTIPAQMESPGCTVAETHDRYNHPCRFKRWARQSCVICIARTRQPAIATPPTSGARYAEVLGREHGR